LEITVKRPIVYPGAIPLDTDVLGTNQNIMEAIGYALQLVLGTTGTVVDGLACGPTTPASMSVVVGPGSISTMETIDATAYGSIAADTADPLVKMGINTTSTTFALTAPTTSGNSINYLLEASFEEADGTPVVLPYYNANNPSQPYSGPANNGVAQNTVRNQTVQLQLKAGAPATAGTQTTPAVDSGWVGLYIITVNYGQTTVTATSISVYPGAPFLPAKLPRLGWSAALWQDTGSVNAVAVTLNPVPTAMSQLVGRLIPVNIAHTNTSTSPTISFNGLTPVTITNPNGSALSVDQLTTGGAVVMYDGTNAELMSVSDLSGYATLGDLSGYATLGDLSPYALISDLAAYTQISQTYATIASLSSYATKASTYNVWTGQDSGYTVRSDGIIDQTIYASIACGSGVMSTEVTLPIAFPNECLDAVICLGGSSPPGSGTPGSICVTVNTSKTQVLATTNFSALSSLAVVIRARGY
jgi:hypothetical protein